MGNHKKHGLFSVLCVLFTACGSLSVAAAEEEPLTLTSWEGEEEENAKETEIETLYKEDWFSDLKWEAEKDAGTWEEVAPGEYMWLPASWVELPFSEEFSDPYVVFQAFDETLTGRAWIWQGNLKDMFALEFSEEEEGRSACEVIEEDGETLDYLLESLAESYTEARAIRCNGRGAIGVFSVEEETPEQNLAGIILPGEKGWEVCILMVCPGTSEVSSSARAILSSFGAAVTEEEAIASRKETLDLGEARPVSAVNSMGPLPYAGKSLLNFFYDDQGNQTEVHSYAADGSLLSVTTYKRDDRGNVTESLLSAADREVTTTYRLEYEGGELPMTAVSYLNGLFDEETEYLYEGEHLTGKTIRDESGEIVRTVAYTYDEDGRLLAELTKDRDGNPGLKREYRYDRYNRTQLVIISMGGEILQYECYQYEEG